MTADIFTWMWLAGGLLLIGLEIAWPHFFASFFGLGALIVAVLRWIGLVDSLVASFAVWIVASTVLVVTMRQLAMRLVSSESTYELTDEDLDAVGQVVEVVSTVSPREDTGRVRYRGSTWPAVSVSGTILPGQQAKLLFRDNLVWRVEPLPNYSSPESTPVKQTEES